MSSSAMGLGIILGGSGD